MFTLSSIYNTSYSAVNLTASNKLLLCTRYVFSFLKGRIKHPSVVALRKFPKTGLISVDSDFGITLPRQIAGRWNPKIGSESALFGSVHPVEPNMCKKSGFLIYLLTFLLGNGDCPNDKRTLSDVQT